jgi:6-phosphofructokinase 1
MRGRNHYWDTYRVLASEPRHLIRAIPPSVADVIFAQRLGVLAVDNAMAGYTDFMISQWLTEYVLVPLDLVVLGRKRLPNGFFMKAVLENTRQPRKM